MKNIRLNSRLYGYNFRRFAIDYLKIIILQASIIGSSSEVFAKPRTDKYINSIFSGHKFYPVPGQKQRHANSREYFYQDGLWFFEKEARSLETSKGTWRVNRGRICVTQMQIELCRNIKIFNNDKQIKMKEINQKNIDQGEILFQYDLIKNQNM